MAEKTKKELALGNSGNNAWEKLE
jgi:hypothetical protein